MNCLSDLQCRRAGLGEQAYFWWLHQLCYRPLICEQFGGWDTQDQHAAFLRKWVQGGFQVVEVNGQPIGGLWTRDTDDCHEVLEIQLQPDWQGRGIGTRLLRHEIRRAHACNKPLRLAVLFRNRALSLYRRLGFEPVGQTAFQFILECRPAAQ